MLQPISGSRSRVWRTGSRPPAWKKASSTARALMRESNMRIKEADPAPRIGKRGAVRGPPTRNHPHPRRLTALRSDCRQLLHTRCDEHVARSFHHRKAVQWGLMAHCIVDPNPARSLLDPVHPRPIFRPAAPFRAAEPEIVALKLYPAQNRVGSRLASRPRVPLEHHEAESALTFPKTEQSNTLLRTVIKGIWRSLVG